MRLHNIYMFDDLYSLFSGSLDADEIITDPDIIKPLLIDQRQRYEGQADLILKPKNTASVQKVLSLCTAHEITVTPQGGNTGLCGGATPQGGVLLCLSRLNQIHQVNIVDMCITVGAGAILKNIQQAALQADLFFPLSLASEGSCQIGGNIACNAGGLNVLRYGTARDLVLGLEVVLPDGSLISHLTSLHKNTTGLDSKHIFIGSEGILGVITAATLKLFPKPNHYVTAWVGCQNIDEAMQLLTLMRQNYAEQLNSFELMSSASVSLSSADCQKEIPLPQLSPWVILLELSNHSENLNFFEQLPEILFQAGFQQVAIAQNESQRKLMWQLRENISFAQKRRGVSIKHDIALPICSVGDFIDSCEKELQQAFSNVEIVLFGHLGDGSLHYNIFLPEYPNETAYQFEDILNKLVYNCVFKYNGTIAAEHGIGQLKKQWILQMRTPEEIALMYSIKQCLDPKNIMNPNKVLPD